MARALWKGSINFGLVNIAIELYAAVQEHTLGFKLLHAKCHNPITNKRWCSHCNEEVKWEDTVKGIKLKDGSYFIITPENLKKLKPQKTSSITIKEFVDKDAIATIYYDHHYYVLPQNKDDNAFFLFATALKKFGKVAVGQFVMRDKEHVCMFQPYKSAMTITTLNYSYEVKHIAELESLKPPAKVNKEELELAELLMKRLYNKTFDMSKYKDTFVQQLLKNIKDAQAGKKVLVKPEKKEFTQPSLIQALRESLQKQPKK